MQAGTVTGRTREEDGSLTSPFEHFEAHACAAASDEAQGVVTDYQTLVADLENRVERFDSSLARWTRLAAALLTFLLVWAAVAQVGMFIQGWDLANAPPRDQVLVVEKSAPE